MKDIDININLAVDTSFIALTPAFNINLYSRSFEFEWLIFGIYISKSGENEDLYAANNNGVIATRTDDEFPEMIGNE